MPYKPYSYSADGPRVKRTTRAKIKIAPYKDHPVVYNIWFDNVGFGINLETSYFKKQIKYLSCLMMKSQQV